MFCRTRLLPEQAITWDDPPLQLLLNQSSPISTAAYEEIVITLEVSLTSEASTILDAESSQNTADFLAVDVK